MFYPVYLPAIDLAGVGKRSPCDEYGRVLDGVVHTFVPV